MDLLDLLTAWLPGRRWYTGKGRTPELTAVGELTLPAQEVEVRVLLVREHSAAPVLYQVPLALSDAPGPEEASVGRAADGRWVLDACQVPAGAAALLGALDAEVAGDGLSTRGHRTGPALIVRDAHVLRGEQSNTSVILDAVDGSGTARPVILKVFRVLHPGLNPDVEVQQALAAAGSAHVPAPVGDVLGTWSDGAGEAVGHLALAQEFLPGVEDAWRVALAALTAGRDFADRARALGAATAEVHDTLARVLPTAGADRTARELAEAGWRGRYAAACEHVPALAGRARDVEAVLAAGAQGPWPALQRVHGDYHLGQVLDVPDRGWVLLDFEGEPLRPLAERTEPDLALRDVAGMLRSFDYAAASVPDAADPAGWAAGARSAFLDGYAAAGEDPRAQRDLLRALELDKALYEVVYEARNRPSWLPIPLAGVDRLLTDPT